MQLKFSEEEYIYKKPFNHPRHWWQTVGPKGAVHFHASIVDGYPPSCGLEIHYCEPPAYMADSAPSHLNCPLTGGRCWHDGTSLYAVETLWPRISDYLKIGDHESVFKILRNEYISRFYGEEED